MTGLAERLWPRLVTTANGCMEWTGANSGLMGYGQIRRSAPANGLIPTHRAAWELTHGPIPEGLWVLHKCDNPPCCNPEHLFLGDRSANVNDMHAKGRWARARVVPLKCPQGHPYSADNLVKVPARQGTKCLTCKRNRDNERVACECGYQTTRGNLRRHVRTTHEGMQK